MKNDYQLVPLCLSDTDVNLIFKSFSIEEFGKRLLVIHVLYEVQRSSKYENS